MRTFSYRAALSASLLSLVVPAVLAAQARTGGDREVRIERLPGTMSIAFGNSNRAVLGVTLAPNGRGDTTGVRIESVDADGPAAKSGLKAGDIITAVNGVSLRVSAEDANDPALGALGQRRLTRTLAKAKAGDAVDLRVQSGGASRNVTVKTVSAADLDGARTRVASRSSSGSMSSNDEQRGVIGLSIGGSGNSRDTLGLFVNSVVSNGPADKAGVTEGERIAAVNGVDVRVPREDVEDMSAMSARANRFIREVQKVAPGSNVSLRVYSGGRYRDVTVKAVRSSELPQQAFRMSIGEGGMSMSLPRIPNALFEGGRVQIDRGEMERAMQELRRNMQDMGRDMRFELRDDTVRLRERLRDSMPRIRERIAPIVRVAPRRAVYLD